MKAARLDEKPRDTVPGHPALQAAHGLRQLAGDRRRTLALLFRCAYEVLQVVGARGSKRNPDSGGEVVAVHEVGPVFG